MASWLLTPVAWCVTWRYNDRGFETECAQYDAAGRPIVRSGFARRAVVPDARGRWLEAAYFGTDGRPIIGGPITPNSLNNGEAPFPEFHDVYIERDNLSYFQQMASSPREPFLSKSLYLRKKEITLTVQSTRPPAEDTFRANFMDLT